MINPTQFRISVKVEIVPKKKQHKMEKDESKTTSDLVPKIKKKTSHKRQA